MNSEINNNLVKSAKKGNAEAFGELYEVYAEDLFRFAYYYLGTVEEAEDAVSESVCIAFSKISQLKKVSAFKSWIFKILHNCCNKQLREKIQGRNNLEFTSLINLKADSEGEIDRIILKTALSELGDEEREILILHFSSGYTSKEIGSIMGLKDSTVRSKLKRSIEKMRTFLEI